MDNDKQKKGWLSTSFRKAVLLGVTSVALMAGVSSNAQAQSNGGYYNNDGQSQTQNSRPQHPWSGNPTYQQQIRDQEELSAGRLASLDAREQADLAKTEAWHQTQLSKEVGYGSRIANQRNKPHGLGAITQWGAVAGQANAVEAQYRAAIIKTQAIYDAARIRENEQKLRIEANIDNQWARQYGVQLKQSQAQRVETQQVSAKPGTGALTPEQQHDRLVRAYQDAQLKAATSGGKIAAPNPANFGLSPKDPAIQP